MKTSEFLSHIKQSNKPVLFKLASGEELRGDLHLTEIKNVEVKSTDCGGNTHAYKETIVQLWQNERSEKTAAWNTHKIKKIVEVVERKMELDEETEFYVEFGNSTYRTSVHAVKWVEMDCSVTIELLPTYTQCKPASLTKLACC